MELPRTADIAVVGGGVQGASLFYHLARRRAGQVVLLERRFLAAGATGKSSAQVRTQYSHFTHLDWTRRMLTFFQNAREIVGDDCGVVCTGHFYLMQQQHRAAAVANVANQNKYGIRSRLVDTAFVKERYPELTTDDVDFAWYHDEAGYADPVGTTTAFANRGREAGGTIVQNCEVRRILVEGGRVRGVETSQGTLAAPVVALANGSGARKLAAAVGLDLPIQNVRHEMVALLSPPGFDPVRPIIGDYPNAIYFRTERTGVCLVGETRVSYGEAVDNEDDLRNYCDPEELASLSERLVRRLPVFETATLRNTYAGLYNVTPDGQPILGAVPEIPGLFTTVGWCHGFKLAPPVGEDLATAILEGQDRVPHLDEFRWSRFREGKLIQVPHPYVAGPIQLI